MANNGIRPSESPPGSDEAAKDGLSSLNIDCVDPLGRSALLLAIESEQLVMVELLVSLGVSVADSLLHAIDQEFVEAVELLLEHEELHHREGELYSWESIDRDTASYTPEITPLILASHKNNYEILKILLDRGAAVPMPHDIRCPCDECVQGVREDSLRHSASRINSYKALASPSLIALTSVDPILTAFELSWELKQLSFAEKEFRGEYLQLRKNVQNFAVDLLSHTRTTHELEVMLNYDPCILKDDDEISLEDLPKDPNEGGLTRLRLAITYKQKMFIAHSWVQQLLASKWYEGLPGFRQKSTIGKCLDTIWVIVAFPLYCLMYMIAPCSSMGKLTRKPFVKFLIHAASYLFFLLLLILVSQRVEEQLFDWLERKKLSGTLGEMHFRQVHRGKFPTYLELFVTLYILGYIVEETRELFRNGAKAYASELWNSIDFLRNSLYVMVFVLRAWAFLQQRQEINEDPQKTYIAREDWNDFDPQLIAEGLFAAANIFSALKLVQISSINPYLGPLQISLGRMVVDILKFFFFYTLVLFAFACGLNQLLWYFATLEKQKCYSLPGGLPDWNKNPEACMKWRRFGNLFESCQSLFWASFGMVGLSDFDLTGIKSYTRFWGLLMFGSYSVINVIVLLNLLIAMMSNSYAMITEKADTEWKFARTKLWLTYFDTGSTLPAPFNLFPTLKHVKNIFKKCIPFTRKNYSKHREDTISQLKQQTREYTAVMRALVWRYVSYRQRKGIQQPVTEDDINEIKTEISSLRHDLYEIFRSNGYALDKVPERPITLSKRTREWERRLFGGFHVAPAAGDEVLVSVQTQNVKNSDVLESGADRFRRMAKMALLSSQKPSRNPKHVSHIGRSTSSESFASRQSLKKALLDVKSSLPKGAIPPSPTSTTVATAGASVQKHSVVSENETFATEPKSSSSKAIKNESAELRSLVLNQQLMETITAGISNEMPLVGIPTPAPKSEIENQESSSTVPDDAACLSKNSESLACDTDFEKHEGCAPDATASPEIVQVVSEFSVTNHGETTAIVQVSPDSTSPNSRASDDISPNVEVDSSSTNDATEGGMLPVPGQRVEGITIKRAPRKGSWF